MLRILGHMDVVVELGLLVCGEEHGFGDDGGDPGEYQGLRRRRTDLPSDGWQVRGEPDLHEILGDRHAPPVQDLLSGTRDVHLPSISLRDGGTCMGTCGFPETPGDEVPEGHATDRRVPGVRGESRCLHGDPHPHAGVSGLVVLDLVDYDLEVLQDEVVRYSLVLGERFPVRVLQCLTEDFLGRHLNGSPKVWP